MHAARGHTLVSRFNDDGYTFGAKDIIDGVGDLYRQFLLDLESFTEGIDDTGQLTNAYNAPIRQVCDVRPADDGNHVVLTIALEPYVTQEDDFVIALDLLESTLEESDWIDLVSAEQFEVGAGDASGCVAKTLAMGVVARPTQKRANGGLGFGLGWAGRLLCVQSRDLE